MCSQTHTLIRHIINVAWSAIWLFTAAHKKRKTVHTPLVKKFQLLQNAQFRHKNVVKNLRHRFHCIWYITTRALHLIHYDIFPYLLLPHTEQIQMCQKKRKKSCNILNTLLIHWKCRKFSALIFPSFLC